MQDERVSVPYIVYEGEQARNERTFKRLIIALIITIMLLFATNALWIGYMIGFDIETYSYAQDGQGVNIIGDRNGVDYDVASSDSENNDSQEKSAEEISSTQE